ncbi:hypothetical protein MLD38_022300 [Melastoma candidum]|uniref:Uncharacterized protein n=1 Tax=Melastoma candidum TaxID=119954 RepID=A0ACB9QIP2_9MYRT|nr:hypothetical protein MLD38_022300 [Melastoma candidum]
MLAKAVPIRQNSSDDRWKFFDNCLGALDGTYIRIRVPGSDKPRYWTYKGEIAINILGVCTLDAQFSFVFPSWEGSAADGKVLRDAMSRRFGLKVPHGGSVSSHSKSQDRASKRKWTPVEDSALPSCMVDLYNLGTYRADMGTLKMDWSILYDLSKSDSCFGWDSERSMPITSDEVWNKYTKVHKEATGFRYRSFPYYQELSMTYGKDRATGKYGQMLEELLVAISVQKNQSQFGDGMQDSTNVVMRNGNTEHEDMIHNELVGKQSGETTSRRKKRKIESSSIEAFTDASKLIGRDIKEDSERLSRSIEAYSFLIQCQKLYVILFEVEGITSRR